MTKKIWSKNIIGARSYNSRKPLTKICTTFLPPKNKHCYILNKHNNNTTSWLTTLQNQEIPVSQWISLEFIVDSSRRRRTFGDWRFPLSLKFSCVPDIDPTRRKWSMLIGSLVEVRTLHAAPWDFFSAMGFVWSYSVQNLVRVLPLWMGEPESWLVWKTLLISAGEISYIGNVHIDLDGLYGIRELGNRLRRPNCPAGIVLVLFMCTLTYLTVRVLAIMDL